jgi:hypothetical protein
MWRILFLSSGTSAGRRCGCGGSPSSRLFFPAVVLLALTVALPDRDARAGQPGNGSGNFVVHGVAAERAAVIRAHAETVRTRAFETLLGDSSPRPWQPRCDVHVHATPGAFSAAVGGPPDVAQGATSIDFSGDSVSLRRIDLLAAGDALVPPALAHELVHVVLADRFTAGPPPRWADEGLAVLFDQDGKQRDHERDFRAARHRGQAWTAADLVALDDYPPGPGRQRVFYGQSAALVRWLIDRKDARTFVRFLEHCPELGLRAALERHYDLHSVTDLELAWKEVPPMQTFGLAGHSP